MVELGDVINKLKWSFKDIEVKKQKILLDVTYFWVGQEGTSCSIVRRIMLY